jgi:hypothetical protein
MNNWRVLYTKWHHIHLDSLQSSSLRRGICVNIHFPHPLIILPSFVSNTPMIRSIGPLFEHYATCLPILSHCHDPTKTKTTTSMKLPETNGILTKTPSPNYSISSILPQVHYLMKCTRKPRGSCCPKIRVLDWRCCSHTII